MAFMTRTGPAAPATAANRAGALPAPTAKSTALAPALGQAVTYRANGEEVTLGFEDVRAYLCPVASDQECKLFIELCRYNGLNPFLREAYLIKYDKNAPATMVVGKDAYTKRAEAHPAFDGYEAGLVILSNGQIEYREGSAFYDGEQLLGGWARVYRRDRSRPNFEEVKLEEYIAYKDRERTAPNTNWANKPGTMIRKVALVHALREAFPSMLGGLYTTEEMGVEADVEGEFTPVSDAPGRAQTAGWRQAGIPAPQPEPEDDPFVDAADAGAGGDPA